MTGARREGGSCRYYAYDGLQRLTGAHCKASDGSSIYAYEYAHDKVGNRLHIGAERDNHRFRVVAACDPRRAAP